jgi:hypothetical protein
MTGTIDLDTALDDTAQEPIVPVPAIGANGEPMTCMWLIKELGPIPDGHILVFDKSGGRFFRPIRVN